jgi:hypothetical protein
MKHHNQAQNATWLARSLRTLGSWKHLRRALFLEDLHPAN